MFFNPLAEQVNKATRRTGRLVTGDWRLETGRVFHDSLIEHGRLVQVPNNDTVVDSLSISLF